MGGNSSSQFYYAKFETPQQFAVVRINDRPAYLDCADCGAKEPLIGGIEMDASGHIAVIRLENGLFKCAAFCVPCFTRRWEENERNLLSGCQGQGEHAAVSGDSLVATFQVDRGEGGNGESDRRLFE
jgi:hypothetical protein